MEEQSCDNWKIVQTKTFTKWVNNKLKKADYPTIEDLFADLGSGVTLVNLLRALGKDIPRFNSNPISRIHKMENMTIILDFIKAQNISLVNIGPEDIVDGDQKLVLGLVWTLISKLSISDILSSEFFTMREEILAWAQRVTEDYENVKIEDLTTSWQNGIGFNAIIHKFRPKLVPDFYSLDPKDATANCENAFKIAEEHLEIPRLFDPEDIIDVIKPDEKSILTYLSQFYQKFLSEERQMILKDKLRHVLRGVDWSIDARNSYEVRAARFLKEKEELNEKLKSANALFKKFVEELSDLEAENSKLIAESAELHLLLNDIHDMDKIINLVPYSPPEELAYEKIDVSYPSLGVVLKPELLSNAIAEFENSEAMELLKLKDLSSELYSFSDKEEQMDVLASNEKEFVSTHFSSASKQIAADKMREYFESKKNKLEKFVELKKNTESVLNDARKMFRIKDKSKSGFIQIADFKKILRALRFEPNLVDQNIISNEGQISMDKMIEIFTMLSYSKMAKAQVMQAFKEIGNDGSIVVDDVLPNFSFKSLSNHIQDGSISFEAIEKHLAE